MTKKQTVCFHIKTSWLAIARMYNEQGEEYGLTTSMGYVLLNIDTQSGTPATKIGPLIGMEAKSMSRMLNSLAKAGLVVKKKDPDDKRLVKIFLTEKGREKREIAKKVVKKFNSVIKDEISEEKLNNFYEVIEKINKIIGESHSTETF